MGFNLQLGDALRSESVTAIDDAIREIVRQEIAREPRAKFCEACAYMHQPEISARCCCVACHGDDVPAWAKRMSTPPSIEKTGEGSTDGRARSTHQRGGQAVDPDRPTRKLEAGVKPGPSPASPASEIPAWVPPLHECCAEAHEAEASTPNRDMRTDIFDPKRNKVIAQTYGWERSIEAVRRLIASRVPRASTVSVEEMAERLRDAWASFHGVRKEGYANVNVEYWTALARSALSALPASEAPQPSPTWPPMNDDGTDPTVSSDDIAAALYEGDAVDLGLRDRAREWLHRQKWTDSRTLWAMEDFARSEAQRWRSTVEYWRAKCDTALRLSSSRPPRVGAEFIEVSDCLRDRFDLLYRMNGAFNPRDAKETAHDEECLADYDRVREGVECVGEKESAE